MMFVECSLVMLGINALLFFTALLEKTSALRLMVVGLILAMVGLAVLAQHRSEAWMYFGVSLTSAGTGLVLPVIAYLAAGASRQKLASRWRPGRGSGIRSDAWVGRRRMALRCLAQRSFGWLTLPLVVM